MVRVYVYVYESVRSREYERMYACVCVHIKCANYIIKYEIFLQRDTYCPLVGALENTF